MTLRYPHRFRLYKLLTRIRDNEWCPRPLGWLVDEARYGKYLFNSDQEL